MRQVLQQLQRLARCVALCLLATAPALAASGTGPNGINIGIDFNWNLGPQGYTASFIQTVTPGGATLNNCTGGPTTPTSTACDFPIAYSIGGTPQTAVTSGGVYETYPTLPTPPQCNVNPMDSAPLTLWNCFNNDSFGQVFKASATGTLSDVTMPMTCLNPTGQTLTGLFAVIYLVNPGNASIPATPLAQVPVDLSTCPTLTSWSGHAFSAGDFAQIPLNFNGVTLTSGNFYAVYFAGPLVPGAPLPGFTPPAPAPALTEWGAIALAMAFLALGLWKLRRRSAA
jgi:hypothetical protein